MAKLLYQGHGSCRICSDRNTVVYVDPYAGEGYERAADLILVTHEHYDHNNTSLVTLKPGGIILRAKDMLINGAYQTAKVRDLYIEAVPAYNQNHLRQECVGYLLWTDGSLIYCSGDTSETAAMPGLAARGVDYALLPVDGVYNMDAEEAGRCAEMIQARHTIPIHTCFDGLYDPAVAAKFIHPSALYLRAGEEITLT